MFRRSPHRRSGGLSRGANRQHRLVLPRLQASGHRRLFTRSAEGADPMAEFSCKHAAFVSEPGTESTRREVPMARPATKGNEELARGEDTAN